MDKKMGSELWRDWFARQVAWILPRRVASWAAVRVFSEASTGVLKNVHAPDITFDAGLRAWDAAHV